MTLTPAEEKLCTKVAHGDEVILGPDEKIDADVIRHIVLGLPLIGPKSSLWSMFGGKGSDSVLVCPNTVVGIRIRGGIIDKPLDLAGARRSGGAICPLAFAGTRFEGGFIGSEGHFSWLRFDRCTFADAAPRETTEAGEGTALPPPSAATLELSGATIDSDLDMDGIKPASDADHLWISASGVKIAGRLRLNEAVLRPAEAKAPGARRPDALALDLADIGGDFWFEQGQAEGRVNARGARIRGDVWMTAARIGNDPAGFALHMQSARVGGSVLLDGDRHRKDGKLAPFSARGEISLLACEIGVSLVVQDVELESGQGPCLNLSGLRVGNSVQIGGRDGRKSTILGDIELRRAAIRAALLIRYALFGAAPGTKNPKSEISGFPVEAGNVEFRDLAPLEKVRFGIKMIDADVQRFTLADTTLTDDFIASGLTCSSDVALSGTFHKKVQLDASKIGGSLDLSALRIPGPQLLDLSDSTIGRSLRLAPRAAEAAGVLFPAGGAADLTAVSCGTLEDDLGRAWGGRVTMRINHFTYARTGVAAGAEKDVSKPSRRLVGDWIRCRRLDGLLPWRWVPNALLRPGGDHWENWHVRRNWIYQQFDTGKRKLACISRYPIREGEYKPQPFEQAIRVARAEGREDFAIQFEILKQKIEWRIFNRSIRWGLAFLAICLASLYLVARNPSAGSIGWTAFGLVATLFAMVNASAIFKLWKRALAARDGERAQDVDGADAGVGADADTDTAADAAGGEGAEADGGAGAGAGSSGAAGESAEEASGGWRMAAVHGLTWLTYFVPAALVYFHAGWMEEPYYFLVAFFIFAAVRLVSVAAHAVLRVGFGYLRRPIYAICTLLGAFLLGWLGTAVANDRQMLVIDAAPVASMVAPAAQVDQSARPAAGQLLVGTQNVGIGTPLVRDVSCGRLISEPLYALDVLIPLLDLREEALCEVRRSPLHGKAAPAAQEMKGLSGVAASIPQLTVENNNFWAVMKALYAIAGWFIVSLSILTFANIHRGRSDPSP